jgi:ABC-type lipoprotein release transport system permease subunit
MSLLTTIERHRYLIDFALSSLFRHRGKNFALLLVYTLVIFLLGSVLFFSQAIKHEAILLLKDSPEIVVQRMQMGRNEQIPLAYATKIAAIRGVVEVTPRVWGYYFDDEMRATYTLLASDDIKPGTATVGSAIARLKGAYPGDTVTFKRSDGELEGLQVGALIADESQLLSADLVLLSTADYRRLSGLRDGYATDLTVRVRNPKELGVITAKIRAALPDTRPITRTEILRTYDALFDWRSGIVLLVLVSSLLAFIIFAWDKASGLSAEERKEIGILKSVGWETSDIIVLKFWEGLSVSLFSFLMGCLLAYGHVFLQDASILRAVIKGWSTVYPDFHLVPHVSFNQLTILFCLTVLPYTFVTIIPAWRAATIDPDAVMR